jgi:aromatic ring-opening dioxygenase LigB subunit
VSIVFAAIAPHGSIAIAEACEPHERGLATATQDAFRELGRRFARAQPETTIVLTPHNVHVGGAFAVIVAAHLHGSLSEWTTQPIELECAVDRALAVASIIALVDADLPVVGVSFGGNDPEEAVAPMDWGTLIPLWYMGGRSNPAVPTVVVSPARDRPLAEHHRAGAALARAAAASGIVVRTFLPRTTPRRPLRRISRPTVQRATSKPSRRSWRHTLRTP